MLVHLPKWKSALCGLKRVSKLGQCFSTNHIVRKSFEDVIAGRQSEARRSIVVQVYSQKSFDDLYKYGSQFGRISNAYFYTVPKNNSFILLEYENEESANEVFRSSAFPTLKSGVVPVKSSFFWLQNIANKKKLKQVTDPIQLNLSGILEKERIELAGLLQKANSISEQISVLYENTRLNDLSTRLRFIGALQIERALSGLFLNHTVLPFGSSVNGFGKLGCDLDMILHYNTDDCSFNPQNDNSNNRLMFHTKRTESDSDTSRRGVVEKHIKFYGAMCEYFIPGATEVLPIYKARVPIVRYSHKYLNVSVDISLQNMTGFYISELFHNFGEIDDRVRPLVFLVRRWAHDLQVMSKSRSHSLTNFLLTCLVLNFLQKLPQPILPTVPELVSKARKQDIRTSSDNRQYTFLRDLSELQFKTENSSSLEELFLQFLEFYGTFDFGQNLISLTSTRTIRKIENAALQISNPFEMEQNWSRNVTSDECIAFKLHAQDTMADLLEIGSTTKSSADRWGILSILPNLK